MTKTPDYRMTKAEHGELKRLAKAARKESDERHRTSMKVVGIVTTRETFVLNVDKTLAVVVDTLGASASGSDNSPDA